MELYLQGLFGLIYEGAIYQPRQTTSLCDPLAWARGRELHGSAWHLTSSAVCAQSHSNNFGIFLDSHCHLTVLYLSL
jgi:hypothetical protein